MASRQIRPIRVEGNIAYVPLTQGYEAIIDAADALKIASWNWYALAKPTAVYAVRGDTSTGKRREVRLHRAIMTGLDGLEVDHINGDGLDNRRSNLRAATHAQNSRNSRTPKNNTSGFKGVILDKPTGKWRAQIRLDGAQKHLGYFVTPEDAHTAYCKASAELHGEYGRTT